MRTERIILIQLFSLLLISYLTPSCAQDNTSDEDFEVMEQQILQEVNTYRATKRLKPLQMVEMITDAATRHSKDMGRGRVPFGHDGFDDRMDRLMRKIDNANACAENVAFGKFTAQEVVKKWIQSPGHKKNIEGNYNLTGIGVYRGKDGYPYFTQIFINQRAM